jgi:DNA adenine methylase
MKCKVYGVDRPTTLIPTFGGKNALIEPISREIFNFRKNHRMDMDTYAEIFGGGARTMMSLSLSTILNIVYNEYDKNICSLFNIVKRGGETMYTLMRELRELKYCKENFDMAKEKAEQPDTSEYERAICAMILCRWSVVAARGNFKRYSEKTAEKWLKNHVSNLSLEWSWEKSINHLPYFHERLKNVEIICGDFRDVLLKYQNCETALIYADPPYFDRDDYSSNWANSDREEMVDIFLNCKCKIILSGYDTPLYNERLADIDKINSNGWRRKDLGEFTVASAKGKRRHEYLWVNYEDRS